MEAEHREVMALTGLNLINNASLYKEMEDTESPSTVLLRQVMMNQHYILLNLLQMRGGVTTIIRGKCDQACNDFRNPNGDQ